MYQACASRAFTLIELTIVIIITSVLAAFAISKYINLTESAAIASVNQVQGAIASAANLVHASAQAKGIKDGAVRINGRNIQVQGSYPRAHWNTAFRYILDINAQPDFTRRNAECDESLCGIGNQRSIPGSAAGSGGFNVMIWPKGYQLNDRRYAWYHNGKSSASGRVDWGVMTSGCQVMH